MRNLLFKIVGVSVLIGSAVAGWVLMDYRQFTQATLAVPAEGRLYEVRPGMGLKRVARELEQAGVIASDLYLLAMARLQGTADDIKVGEYRLQADMKPDDLLQALVDGDVVLYSLTLIEGWSFRQVMAAVKNSPDLVHTLEATDGDTVMAALGLTGQHPEGRFFPDTYFFPRGTKDIDFLERAYLAMEDVLEEEWAERAAGLPYDTPYEALTMASLVEKETAVPEERPAIAGVFVRRLEKGMRLQTDPTVIYGMGEEFDGDIRRRDLKRDNPYNTYRRHGLPPTPIANPGRAAIHAALNPLPGDALYFVSRGDGSHHFSATLEEHNKAVVRYQLNRDSEPEATEQAGATE